MYDTVCNSVYDNVIKDFAEPSREKLLPDLPPKLVGKEKPTLVVSLDGCLIQSSWTRQHGWRYIKRPGVDQFLASLAPLYELVLWTDTMNAGDPVVVGVRVRVILTLTLTLTLNLTLTLTITLTLTLILTLTLTLTR